MPITAAKARKIAKDNKPLTEIEQIIDEIDETIEECATHGLREAAVEPVDEEHRRRVEAYYRKRKFKVGKTAEGDMKIIW